MRKIEPRQWFRAAAYTAAALLVAGPAFAAEERLPLSERVARLEQQAQGNQQSVELLNRVNELQQEVQSLRGTIEQQNNEIEGLKKRQRDQYLDLDSRLNRMGGGANPGGAPAPGPEGAPNEGRPQLNAEPVESNEPPPPRGPDTRDLAPPPTGAAPPRAQGGDGGDLGNEKAAYDDAFGSLREGRYAESARRFQEFLERYPDSDLSDNAHYWLGESYYVTQNYKVALDTFQMVLKRYPQSPKAPDALLKVGYCQFELHDFAAAEATLNEVVRRYPDTTVSRLAEGRLRALRIENRR